MDIQVHIFSPKVNFKGKGKVLFETAKETKNILIFDLMSIKLNKLF